MIVIGKTTDGKAIVSGVAKMYFETGLPLSFVFDRLKSNNCVPSWVHLYNEMTANGMSHKRIIDILNEQVFECYGKEFRDVVIDRLHKYEQIKNKS